MVRDFAATEFFPGVSHPFDKQSAVLHEVNDITVTHWLKDSKKA